MDKDCMSTLAEYPSFNRDDFYKALCSSAQNYSRNTSNVILQRLLRRGDIIRVGRNAYCVSETPRKDYSYQHSPLVYELSEKITEEYPLIEYNLFELVQLNEFVNHQIAHNTVFVSVEADLGAYVFEMLKPDYQGRILLAPDEETYFRYLEDEMIVIIKRMSEVPRSNGEKWRTSLEKLLVDLFAEPLYRAIVSDGEYPAIFQDSFEKYVIDESKLFRYARRRGAEDRIKEFIETKTEVRLRTV